VIDAIRESSNTKRRMNDHKRNDNHLIKELVDFLPLEINLSKNTAYDVVDFIGELKEHYKVHQDFSPLQPL
jgi:hypothetical protein